MIFPEMPEYHLLKRKAKDGKLYYHAAFLSDEIGKNGRPKYRAIENTGIAVTLGKDGKPTKQGLINAGRAAESMLKKGTVIASRDNLEEFLLTFWDEGRSEYLRSRYAETGRKYSQSYLNYNLDVITRYFLPYAKKSNVKTLKDVSPIFLERWRNHLLHDEKIGTRTVNKTRQSVFVPLRYAVNRGMLPFHPGERIKAVHDKPKEKQIFEIDELKALFGFEWPDIRVYAAAMLSVTTGMRIGEVRGLLVKNLHLENKTVDVLTSWADSEGIKPPKWEKERKGLCLPGSTIEAIEKVLSLHKYGARPDDYVFFSLENHLKPISYTVLSKGLRGAIKTAGLSNSRGFHNLRHTYISHAVHKLSPAALRDYIGHSDLKTTEGYQHITAADRKALSDLSNSILPGTEEPVEKIMEIVLTIQGNDPEYEAGESVTVTSEGGKAVKATVKEIMRDERIPIVGK